MAKKSRKFIFVLIILFVAGVVLVHNLKKTETIPVITPNETNPPIGGGGSSQPTFIEEIIDFFSASSTDEKPNIIDQITDVILNCDYGSNNGACCQADYSDVLVVTNLQSSISKEVSSYFISKRKIQNQIMIDVVESENINYTTFSSNVFTPIKAYLNSHPNIKYIVTTKGVPIRVTSTCETMDGSNLALDSMLAYNTGECDGWKANSYGQIGSKVIPVTRLDGYTLDDIKKLITPKVCNNLNGLIILDTKGTGDIHDADMVEAYNYLTTTQQPVFLETTTTFMTNTNNIDGYISWGSNDGHITANSSRWGLGFNPGSIGDTWVSTSARSFKPGTSYGQSLIADLIHNGISGVNGFTDEPKISAVPEPKKLFQNYLGGNNLADSFYKAIPYVSWRNIVIGDPKLYVVQGGNKTSLSCSNICTGNIVSYNGIYVNGKCEYKNLTCEYGCSNGKCTTPPSCKSGSITCEGITPKLYCGYQSFFNGIEYTNYYRWIDLAKEPNRKPCSTSFYYCINGVPECSSSLPFQTITTSDYTVTYTTSGTWKDIQNAVDGVSTTYASADVTTGTATIYKTYTFPYKIISFVWTINNEKAPLTWDNKGSKPISPATMGSNELKVRIEIRNVSNFPKIYYGYWNGTQYNDFCYDCLGSPVFNLRTNRFYDDKISSVMIAECMPNDVKEGYICGADFRWRVK